MSDDQDIKVTFTPPKEIHVIGSAALGPQGPPGEGGSGNGGGGAGGAIDQGDMHSFLDHNGDFWMVANATLASDGTTWNRIDESKFSFAMQWIVKGIIPGEELIDPIGGVVWWRCIPGANPIGPFAAFGGWENVYLMTQYRDFVIGGQAIEMDGAGTFPFGRFIHAPEGTFMCQNAYADLNGRDDNNVDSLIWGMFGEEIKAKLWKANDPKSAAIDLLTLTKDGDLSVAGEIAGIVSGGGGGSAELPPRLGVSAQPISDWNDAITNGWYCGTPGAHAPGVAAGASTIGFVSAVGAWVTQELWLYQLPATQQALRFVRRYDGNWGPWYMQAVPQPPVISGQWQALFPYHVLATSSFGAGSARVTRTVLTSPITAMQAEVTTPGSTTGKFVAYNDTPTGPGALNLQSADMSLASAGIVSTFMTLPAGVWWLGFMNDGGAAATMRTVAGSNPDLPGHAAPGTNAMINAWAATGLGTSVPDPFPLGSVARNSTAAAIYAQAA